jgi:hypothetical protein
VLHIYIKPSEKLIDLFFSHTHIHIEIGPQEAAALANDTLRLNEINQNQNDWKCNNFLYHVAID